MHICIMVHPASPLGVLDAGWTAATPASSAATAAPSAAAPSAAAPSAAATSTAAPPAAASPLGVLDAAWAAPVLPSVGNPAQVNCKSILFSSKKEEYIPFVCRPDL